MEDLSIRHCLARLEERVEKLEEVVAQQKTTISRLEFELSVAVNNKEVEHSSLNSSIAKEICSIDEGEGQDDSQFVFKCSSTESPSSGNIWDYISLEDIEKDCKSKDIDVDSVMEKDDDVTTHLHHETNKLLEMKDKNGVNSAGNDQHLEIIGIENIDEQFDGENENDNPIEIDDHRGDPDFEPISSDDDDDIGIEEENIFKCLDLQIIEPYMSPSLGPSEYQHTLTNAFNPKRTYTCHFEGCKRTFTRPYLLKRHLNSSIHNPVKRFVCFYDGCGKKFQTRYNLNRHELFLHTEKLYACDYPGCEKKFGTLPQIRRHVNVHYPKVQ